ncbi:uncharacterized protein TNCV_1747971 [Trichonephila clavipes]|nr:uncharacterized protein TNCV_1747971 [Trichonephila clavipes]
MFKNCRKEDLRIVALELSETVGEKVTIVELIEIIKENKYFKEDVEFVEELIQYTIEDHNERTGEACNSLDALVKSVRILTVKVPNRPEGWAFFFASLERAFVSKNVLEKFKSEILLNLLGEKASNVLTYVKDDELNNYEQLKSIILREYEPSARTRREKNIVGFIQAADNLELSIKKFWEIENVEIDSVKTTELDICEDHFKNTHSRDDQGRYTVAMPLKEDPSCFNEYRQTAIQRLNSLWKRLSGDKEYLSLYEKFLQEYEDLGHMREIKADGSGVSFYMPHHVVYRPEKSTTKLRTVFNASSPSTSGKSLNSIQFNGRLVQKTSFPLWFASESTSMPLLRI